MTQALEQIDTSAYERFQSFVYGYAPQEGTHCREWPGIVFDGKAAAKLGCIAGWLVGLKQAGQEELAYSLAQALTDKLDYLSGYGGEEEIVTMDDSEQTITVPTYQVVLFDDGTFGGFSIGWYRAISRDRLHAKADQLAGSDEWDSDMLDKAKRELGIRDDLEQTRYYTPAWMQERRQELTEKHHEHADDDFYLSCKECNVPAYTTSSSIEFVNYGFSFNGGLLMHGMGQEVFAVELVSKAGPHWSIHT